MANSYAALPTFRHTSLEELLDFLGHMSAELLLKNGLYVSVGKPILANGTLKVRFTINHDRLCCDLAAATFGRFVLEASHRVNAS